MTPEGRLLKSVTEYLDARKAAGEPLFYFKLRGSHRQVSGLPDLVIVYHGVIFAELKKPGEDATKLQAHRIAELRAAGAVADVVRSVGDVERLLGEARDRTAARDIQHHTTVV